MLSGTCMDSLERKCPIKASTMPPSVHTPSIHRCWAVEASGKQLSDRMRELEAPGTMCCPIAPHGAARNCHGMVAPDSGLLTNIVSTAPSPMPARPSSEVQPTIKDWTGCWMLATASRTISPAASVNCLIRMTGSRLWRCCQTVSALPASQPHSPWASDQLHGRLLSENLRDWNVVFPPVF